VTVCVSVGSHAAPRRVRRTSTLLQTRVPTAHDPRAARSVYVYVKDSCTSDEISADCTLDIHQIPRSFGNQRAVKKLASEAMSLSLSHDGACESVARAVAVSGRTDSSH
jgi:hypothetical protein